MKARESVYEERRDRIRKTCAAKYKSGAMAAFNDTKGERESDI
jgi:hypothetical protein